MKKIKVFCGSTQGDSAGRASIETAFNTWYNQNPDIEISDWDFSTTGNGQPGEVIWHLVIFYQDCDKKP